MEWRTLKTNLAERLERIPFALLPDTFAQAIRVTRGLGVRYLWIDALCIIQDDLEDWRREAASMCDVYWNTVCRLAVSDSRRPTEGFFPPAPILASVRVPGLEAGGKGQRMDEDDLYSPMAGQDGGEGEEIEASGANVIPTPSGRTGHMEGEASEKIPAYHVDDNMSSETWWMPSPQGPDASDSHAPPDDTTEFLAMFASKVQEEASEEIPAYHVNDNVNETSRTPPDDINEFLAMFANKAQEENNQDREQKQESQHHALVKKYLTLPRAYAIDVDRAHLNTRGWVLQERLLSPRSIHFTKHQIYCEDQDDICGEDWIRRYFTWRSSVDKASTFTPVELFPERRFNSADRMRENFSAQDNIWSQRATLRRADNHYVADPWLRICERFSESRLTFDTDRLAAIAGLVKKKQELARSESANATATATANNFLGLWEESLHVELAWVARGDGKLKFLRSLGLPSWAWIAYEGCIRFTKESRHFRDPRMMRVPPVAEIQIVEADVPDMTAPLPLEKPASLTVDATVRKIHGISAESTENDTAREEVEAPSPFHLDPESRAAPVPLSALSVCREILDSDEQVVGFVSFDEDEDIRDTVDMFCAQISTLVYEQRPESWNEPMTPVLAYGLVLVKVEESDSEYRRVGLAQVNHGWMTSGTRERVKLV
ncbi:hypothetical protein BJY00DRAFT_284012 [Aspergillus carlsbadensis]|nr:hypothetical protein BJY00DRAFT_284012 [Aspergillus carlsbadensis]